ncbi:ABC transporter substrate-binding protein [Arthrobacter flavus]|uniref:ABC transporter substrate-binding protein n=1 Tax=Arthrobacter flavus TaxID=95172 RepID=A0ABW4Q6E5_9MICC
MIEAFEAENPGIKVRGEYSDFGSYWDRLATQVAGGDAPDIFAMSGSYPSEYASRGALLDLAEVEAEIDTSKFAEGTVELGQIDGVQYTVTAGVNAMSMVVDPGVFEEAGVDIPDDETWTWDEYVKLSAEISDNSPQGTYGTTPMTNDSFLMVWARQHGETLYSEDGSEVAISTDTLTDWFDMNQDLMDNRGAPPAAESVEDIAASPEQTLMGQGKQGMKISWSNQMNAYSGSSLEILKLPGEAEASGSWLRSSQEYAISSASEYPAETATFLNYLVNSPDAAEIIRTDRGMQANLDVREGVLPLLDESDAKEATYLDRIAAMDVQPPTALPPGSSGSLEVLDRQLFEVLFDQTTAEEAALAFIAEVNANLASQ